MALAKAWFRLNLIKNARMPLAKSMFSIAQLDSHVGQNESGGTKNNQRKPLGFGLELEP